MVESNSPRPLCVLFGARTRLGQAWLKTDHAKKSDVLLVARHSQDVAALQSQFPEHRIYLAGDAVPKIENSSVEIIGCAIGLIHPAETSWQVERDHADRDLGVVERICDAVSVPVRIVFVSSVLGLMTRRVMWYGGWKNVIEGALRHIISKRPHVTLAVLYPGRLTENLSGGLKSRLYTTFAHLADQITWATYNVGLKHRLIGLDSRIWVLYQSLPIWMIRRHLHIPARKEVTSSQSVNH